MAPPISPHFLLLLLIVLCSSTVLVQSVVPKDKTFNFINQGKFDDGTAEDNWYANGYRYVGLSSYPFRLYFYTIGLRRANKLVLGISGGDPSGQFMAWVWMANRNDPVGENSTLTFGSDGNLVLANFDGRIVWQTNTADKGVTGISMQPSGNLVLHDRKGRFVWQSFDYPSDGILAGQSLKHSRTKRLVSRANFWESRDGEESIVIGKKGFIMYLNKSGNPLYGYAGWEADGLHSVTFDSVQQDEPAIVTYFVTLGFANIKQAANTTSPPSQPPPVVDQATRYKRRLPGPPPAPETPTPEFKVALPQIRPLQRRIILARVYFGDTRFMGVKADLKYSFLRLDPDGNLRIYTLFAYPNNHTWWTETYAFFLDTVEECLFPSKCCSFGLSKCSALSLRWCSNCNGCPPAMQSGCMIKT
ncbi:EP1-like glycoprotein 2 [Papaver somniferum]|uniref:EP1-like glycoprotein 2 n=1 Tax=Papaver somniferum TaxID=3469 RepID=UPI000E6FF384|nr:EP1-like glycoprotein 2 [Papaver somniferum]